MEQRSTIFFQDVQKYNRPTENCFHTPASPPLFHGCKGTTENNNTEKNSFGNIHESLISLILESKFLQCIHPFFQMLYYDCRFIENTH